MRRWQPYGWIVVAALAGCPKDTPSDGPRAMNQACIDRCAVESPCTGEWSTEQACADACDDNIEEASQFSDACAHAWLSLHVCQGTLTCEEYAAWQDPTQVDYPCADQDNGLTDECEGQ